MLFHIDIDVDERIILTGYDVSDRSLILPNLMLIFAQYTIYRLYTICPKKNYNRTFRINNFQSGE